MENEGELDYPATVEYSDALAAGSTVLHCGRCGACSNRHDMGVIDSTKTFITTKMTACATAFAKPQLLNGHQDVGILEDCLRAGGIDFSTDSRAWPPLAADGKPSCMQCWTDNIQCDAVNCLPVRPDIVTLRQSHFAQFTRVTTFTPKSMHAFFPRTFIGKFSGV